MPTLPCCPELGGQLTEIAVQRLLVTVLILVRVLRVVVEHLPCPPLRWAAATPSSSASPITMSREIVAAETSGEASPVGPEQWHSYWML